MKTKDIVIRAARKAYRALSHKHFFPPECDCNRESSNEKIFKLLSSNKPCMIARFGTVELNCINNYLCIINKEPSYKKIYKYITDNTHTPWWNTDHFYAMSNNAGIFPPTIQTAELFSKRYLTDIPEIDLLACHQYYEKFMPLKDDIIRIQLEMLYPFFVKNPWTRVLKGRKVLIIHPFIDTIVMQYKKRKLLFENNDILPDFDLLTIKALQTTGNCNSGFSNWFEALSFMEDQMDKIDFDIAIIGCGAYGLPLAAHAKRKGKQAIHMGGATQLLFGIKGRRWLEDYTGYWHYRPGIDISIDYRSLFNENWVFPNTNEKPHNANKIENACYW